MVVVVLVMLMGCETATQRQKRLCETEAKTVRTAVEAFYANQTGGFYPSDVNQLVPAYLSTRPTLVAYTGGGTTYSLSWSPKCAAVPGIGRP